MSSSNMNNKGRPQKMHGLVSPDGTRLIMRHWAAKGDVLATICLVHGLGEHSLRYEPWALRLNEQGLEVFALDYRGNGLADGQPGHADSLDVLMEDLAVFMSALRSRANSTKFILYGHSMGGCLALNYLLTHQQDFKGAIITSPWIELTRTTGPWKVTLARLLNHLLPRLSLSTGLHSSDMSRDKPPETETDPLTHKRISVRLFTIINQTGKEMKDKVQDIAIPVLVFHGKKDPVTSWQASKEIAEKMPDCQYLTYPLAYHELHFEPEGEDMLKEIVSWMKPLIEQ